MSGLKLYTYPNNVKANKALIAAQYVGVHIDVPAFQFGVDNKTPHFLSLNPAGKVPVLETAEGGVFESNAIARYVASLSDVGLLGKTDFEQAQQEQWIDFSVWELDAPLMSWLYPLVMPDKVPYNKQVIMHAQALCVLRETGPIVLYADTAGAMPYQIGNNHLDREDQAIAAVRKGLSVLEAYLQTRTYLTGHRVTLADVIVSSNVYNGYTRLFDEAFRKDYPNVTRWFTTLAHQPQFNAVWGAVQLCSQPQKFTPPAKKEKEAPKKEKAQQPKKEKEAPAKAAPAASAAADDEDDTPKPAPKAKNPLDSLPPSKMALDSWKRLYSNTPASQFRQIAIKGLWDGADVPRSQTNEHFEGYDPEGFSMWFSDYKYPEENTVNFIVMNKVGGFLQRIDYVRKYAFGVISILKNDKGEFPVKGLWIFRGQDIPPIMREECVDLELYDWRKADLSDPEQKKLAEDMIVEEDTVAGLELVDTKVFK